MKDNKYVAADEGINHQQSQDQEVVKILQKKPLIRADSGVGVLHFNGISGVF